MMRNIIAYIKTAVYRLFRHLPIKKKTILFYSYYGEKYSGSPKYISEYLQNNTNYNIIWAFTKRKKHIDVYRGKTVHYSGLMYYYHLATAEIIITNYRNTEEFNKRIGQKYIQTWHGALALKMIENDVVESLPDSYIKMAKRDSEQIDMLLVGSEKGMKIFEDSFWYNGYIAKTGTPQCDIFFQSRDEFSDKVKNYFNIPKDGHIVMYAPTFRKNHNTDIYVLDTDKLLNALHDRFGGDWYLLIRLHPHLINRTDFIRYSDKVIQATSYDDSQELLCAADFVISDYSAIIFDYLLTRRPGLLYTPDLQSYLASDRKFYFDINQLPFKCCLSEKSLHREIENFSLNDYEKRVEDFLKEVGNYEDGHACERVSDLLDKI